MLSRLSRSRILLNNLRTPSPNNYSTSIPSTSSSSLNSKSSSSNSNSSTESTTPRPEINYISFETLYPFFLLSVMTSLALNLSHNRSSFKDEELNLKAKISVLEKIVDRLRERGNEEENGATNLKDMVKGKGKEKRNNTWLTEEEQESIERELELVGLGRNKGKSVESILKNVGSKVGTSWREVFLGKKGKEWEEVDETDWEKVFKDADEKDKKALLLAKSGNKKSTTVEVIPVPTSIPASDPIKKEISQPVQAQPISQKPKSPNAPVYL